MTPAMTSERWQHIKHVVNEALDADSQDRTAILQQSCAEDFALRIGAEALLSVTRKLPEHPLAPDDWQRIEQIFQSALALSPSQRGAFLDEACRDEADLRHEVESLLIYQNAAGGLIQGAIHEAAGLLPNDEKSRFTSGTILNKRYRILGLLGKGGMGEVYRADDLKLNQPVALKFLTEKLSQDKAMLARFHGEVAMAHRVTHPNVCRVHDLGEVITSAGVLHFLSMEYVDGEDLSSLLRRIGRLPSDKAVEIAQQLCEGLAAAHEAGVLHRDLKPANVMIDGRGRVRITDFGLAGFAEQFTGSEVFAGTPAYMSPEQFAGREVTTKSDIYALGLVLYEVFTGKRVFEAGSLDELKRMHESSAPTNPSNWVSDIDPLVERVILRCLEKDPAQRWHSAQQVAQVLPGGDPLAAALAFGETPSPEMVAAAGQKTGIKPIYAVACLLVTIISLFVIAYLNSKTSLVMNASLNHPPEVMANNARQIIKQLGYSEQAADRAYGLAGDYEGFAYYAKLASSSSADRWQIVREGKTPVVHFWYRQSPREMVSQQSAGRITTSDPPETTSGMVTVLLTPLGQLIRFSAVPPQALDAAAKMSEPDWKVAFNLAGLDFTRFTPTPAQWLPNPVVATDIQMAWTGAAADQPEMPLRVEAAAFRGKLVSFQVVAPYTLHNDGPGIITGKVSLAIFCAVFSIIAFGTIGLIRYNLRRERGDLKGAVRLASFIFIAALLEWVLGTVRGAESLSATMANSFGKALFQGVGVGLMYLALEPFVRRRLPTVLITWNRVLQGKLKDPLVGRDVLIGVLWMSVLVLPLYIESALKGHLVNDSYIARVLGGTRYVLAEFSWQTTGLLHFAFGVLFMIFLLLLLTRRQWLAGGIMVVLLIIGFNAFRFFSTSEAILSALTWGAFVVIMLRFGLLPCVIGILTGNIIGVSYLTLQFSAWYAGSAVCGLAVLFALAAYGFYTSLGGQKVFSGNLLEE